LTERISIGITPMLESVSFVDTEALTTIVSDATGGDIVGAGAQNVTTITSKNARSLAISALLGAQYRFAKGWAAGASLQFPSLAFAGDYEAARSAETTISDASEYVQDQGDARFRYPLRLAAGVAGTLPSMSFELDVFFHAGSARFAEVNSTREFLRISDGVVSELGSEPATQMERVRPTVNVGFGVDVPLGKKWSVVSGVLSDFSGLPARAARADDDASLFRSRVNAVHASGGVAWTPRVGSIMLGLRGMYGRGELALSDPRTLPTQRVAVDQTLWGLALVISGQVTLGLLAMVDPTGIVKEQAQEEQAPKRPKP
jgi:hypothetical protein